MDSTQEIKSRDLAREITSTLQSTGFTFCQENAISVLDPSYLIQLSASFLATYWLASLWRLCHLSISNDESSIQS